MVVNEISRQHENGDGKKVARLEQSPINHYYFSLDRAILAKRFGTKADSGNRDNRDNTNGDEIDDIKFNHFGGFPVSYNL